MTAAARGAPVTPTGTTARAGTDQDFAKSLAGATTAPASARRNTGRVMRPVLVPRAVPLATAVTAKTGRTGMTAAQAHAAYGGGTLADILARIRRV
ncbi:hypothetical protein LPN01_16080 [Sphingomonas sp. A2-49]|uniref:hypothetical protein n=1 Tax=Sphingomonas sp. A2-49 TaxID=1391375 RepID=UPI0021D0C253|nr:hypothetical protein [Sphingomonas sp. A2-49]MCU6455598.1 hypothetical protein [Sphingomonas sp. A2-49]